MRATGLSFDQLEVMDGEDYGALVSDLRTCPPLHKWLPAAMAEMICIWGGCKRVEEVMARWGFKTGEIDVSAEDAAFIAALKKG